MSKNSPCNYDTASKGRGKNGHCPAILPSPFGRGSFAVICTAKGVRVIHNH